MSALGWGLWAVSALVVAFRLAKREQAEVDKGE